MVQIHRDRSGGRFSLGHPLIRCFDTVGHAVAQQVFERRRHAIEHAAIHFDRTARNVELDLLAGLFGRLAHHGIQPLGNAFKLHHARPQQVALKFSGLATLGNQIILGTFHRALQVALNGGHVVDRLGHHAGQLLHPGETVELQRVEPCGRILGQGQTRLHLRLGLDFDIPQLLAQAFQVARKVRHGTLELTQPRLHARAGDHHLARLVDQPIQKLCAHPHRMASGRSGRRQFEGPLGLGHRRTRCLRHRQSCVNRNASLGLDGSYRDGFRRQLGTDDPQGGKVGRKPVETALQRLDVRRLNSLNIQLLDGGFQTMGQLSQPHGTRQARTALERVQCPQNLGTRAQVVRSRRPLAQGASENRQELCGLFLKNGEQIWVNDIDGINIIVNVCQHGWCLGHRLGDVRRQMTYRHREGGRHIATHRFCARRLDTLRCGFGVVRRRQLAGLVRQGVHSILSQTGRSLLLCLKSLQGTVSVLCRR